MMTELAKKIASTDSLPLTNTPEVFGLHPNAEINYYSQTTREIWSHLIELQPQTGEFMFSFVNIVLYTINGGVLKKRNDYGEKA